jgi:predicted RNA-binding Zn-ribbon protein involved in translation (DUF1610 family)
MEISHPAVAFSGTLALGTPRPSLSRAVWAAGMSVCHATTTVAKHLPYPRTLIGTASIVAACLPTVTKFHCPKCPKSLSRKDSLCRHLVQVHGCTESDAKMLVEDVVTKRY